MFNQSQNFIVSRHVKLLKFLRIAILKFHMYIFFSVNFIGAMLYFQRNFCKKPFSAEIRTQLFEYTLPEKQENKSKCTVSISTHNLKTALKKQCKLHNMRSFFFFYYLVKYSKQGRKLMLVEFVSMSRFFVYKKIISW